LGWQPEQGQQQVQPGLRELQVLRERVQGHNSLQVKQLQLQQTTGSFSFFSLQKYIKCEYCYETNFQLQAFP
jgi:hypothetical protein